MKKTERTNEKTIAMRVSVVTVAVNLLLAAGKMIVGIIAHSGAMISDAVHSASDVFSTFVVMIGIIMSHKQSDEGHPYGHERLECVVSILLSVLLGLTGLGIGFSGLEKIFGDAEQIVVPGKLALAAAAVSIVVKEWMYWYTKSAAKKLGSGALMADAWHHRSDALSSVGALIGIGGALMGYPIMDPLASVVICFFIEKVAFDIFMDAVEKMVDKSAPAAVEKEIYEIVRAQEGVIAVDEIKTRMFASKFYVDVEIAVDGQMTVSDAHEIAQQVHDKVETECENVKHCMVHVNPA